MGLPLQGCDDWVRGDPHLEHDDLEGCLRERRHHCGLGWFGHCHDQLVGGKVTMATLGTNEVMLSGNLIAIFSSGIIHYCYSNFVDPHDFDFNTLNANIQLVEQDLSGLSAVEMDKVMIRKTKRWITNRGYVLTFVLILVWPILSIPAQVFFKSYFAFWVVISIAWGFGAAIVISVLPLWESQTDIIKVISGIMNYCMGRHGNATQYAAEGTPVKTVDEPAKAPPAPAKAENEEELDAKFVEILKA